MCPDKELLSAYYDSETDGKWMSGIKTHLKECENCLIETTKYNSLTKILRQAEVPDEQAIKNRIYSTIERKRTVIYPEPFWRKHFDVSFTALMSAAAVIVLICAALIVGVQKFSRPQAIVEEIKEEPEIRVQILSLDDAAAYLLSDDSGFDVLITIPSSDTLSITGEPQLIREADYRQSQ